MWEHSLSTHKLIDIREAAINSKEKYTSENNGDASAWGFLDNVLIIFITHVSHQATLPTYSTIIHLIFNIYYLYCCSVVVDGVAHKQKHRMHFSWMQVFPFKCNEIDSKVILVYNIIAINSWVSWFLDKLITSSFVEKTKQTNETHAVHQ